LGINKYGKAASAGDRFDDGGIGRGGIDGTNAGRFIAPVLGGFAR
jgi:hypothetical protein